MSETERAAQSIIKCINAETAGLSPSERAMVLLYVKEITECAVQLDVLDTLHPRGKAD